MGVEFKGNTHEYQVPKLYNGFYCDCGAKKFSSAQFNRLLRGERNTALSTAELEEQFRLAKSSYGIQHRVLPPAVLLTKPNHRNHVVHIDNLSCWLRAQGKPFSIERLVNFLMVSYFDRCRWLDLVDNDLEINLVALEGLNTQTELDIDEAISELDARTDRPTNNLSTLPISRLNRPISQANITHEHVEQEQRQGLTPNNGDDRDSLDELFDEL